MSSVRAVFAASVNAPVVPPSNRVTPPAGLTVTLPAVPSLMIVMAEPLGKFVVDSSGIVHV